MPYIKPVNRAAYTQHLKNIDTVLEAGGYQEGELNYIFFYLLKRALRKKSYKQINKLIGVLECCKLELYRREAAPYEDEKIEENGDVE